MYYVLMVGQTMVGQFHAENNKSAGIIARCFSKEYVKSKAIANKEELVLKTWVEPTIAVASKAPQVRKTNSKRKTVYIVKQCGKCGRKFETVIKQKVICDVCAKAHVAGPVVAQ